MEEKVTIVNRGILKIILSTKLNRRICQLWNARRLSQVVYDKQTTYNIYNYFSS